MSSRDGSGRLGRYGRSSNHRRTSEDAAARQDRQREPWDIDPAEIDRYLSGRPTREQEALEDAQGRRRQDQGTLGQLDQFQRQRRQTPRPQRPSRRPSVGRQQFVEPEPEDDRDAHTRYSYDEFDELDEGYYDDQPVDPAPARPTRRRVTREQMRGPVYDEDDELYADDPYLIYDDDYEEPVPVRRRPAARSRPRPRPTLPAMPKISVPKAITDAELVNDIISLVLVAIAVLSAALMAIVVSNRLGHLPPVIPTHVSASGAGEALRGRNALWSVPLLAGALSLMNLAAAWFLARIDLFAARFLLGASLLVQFVAWIAILKYLW